MHGEDQSPYRECTSLLKKQFINCLSCCEDMMICAINIYMLAGKVQNPHKTISLRGGIIDLGARVAGLLYSEFLQGSN